VHTVNLVAQSESPVKILDGGVVKGVPLSDSGHIGVLSGGKVRYFNIGGRPRSFAYEALIQWESNITKTLISRWGGGVIPVSGSYSEKVTLRGETTYVNIPAGHKMYGYFRYREQKSAGAFTAWTETDKQEISGLTYFEQEITLTETYDGEIWYPISNSTELAAMESSKNYYLTSNIDCSDISEPLVCRSFNGRDKILQNISINKPSDNNISMLHGVSIWNINIIDSAISGNNNIYGLNSNYLYNSCFNGIVNGNSGVYGMRGTMNLSNCFVSGSLNATDSFLASFHSPKSNNISDAILNTGIAFSHHVGGIMTGEYEAAVSDCIFRGTINCLNPSTIRVGGIVAGLSYYWFGVPGRSYRRCTFSGTILGTNNISVGGILGRGQYSDICDCASYGNVPSLAGGVIGLKQSSMYLPYPCLDTYRTYTTHNLFINYPSGTTPTYDEDCYCPGGQDGIILDLNSVSGIPPNWDGDTVWMGSAPNLTLQNVIVCSRWLRED
jgi:hypothetical protein